MGITSPLYRRENPGSQGLNNLLMVTRLAGGWAEKEIRAICLLPEKVSGALDCSLRSCAMFHGEMEALAGGQDLQGSTDRPWAQAEQSACMGPLINGLWLWLWPLAVAAEREGLQHNFL